MKKFALQALLLIIVIGGALYLYRSGTQLSSLFPFLPQPPILKDIQIGNSKLKVEIADTQSKRAKGLSGRDSLASDSGMLFVFSTPSKYSFWMKGLSFPLDFIWIKGDKVVNVLQDVPPPSLNQADSSLPVYQSDIEIDKVLEVSAGTIARLNIKIGDTAKLIN